MNDTDPVDEGEILHANDVKGMLETKSGLVLNFFVDECRGFVPAARNVVAIERIEGMSAFGLSLRADAPPSMFERPVIPAGRIEALLREAADARGPQSRLTAELLRARLPSIAWPRVFSEISHKAEGLALDALAAELTSVQRQLAQLLELVERRRLRDRRPTLPRHIQRRAGPRVEVDAGWDGVTQLERSFLECCRSKVDPSELRD